MRDASQLLRWRQRYDPDGFLLHRSRASLRRPQFVSVHQRNQSARVAAVSDPQIPAASACQLSGEQLGALCVPKT
jgi:hypothetical protein